MRIGKIIDWVRLLSIRFGRSRVSTTPTMVSGILAMYTVLPTAPPSGNSLSAAALLRITDEVSPWTSSTLLSTSLLMYSPASKSRPATRSRPSVSNAPSPTMYWAALSVGISCSAVSASDVFQLPFWNGNWLVMATDSTPEMARSTARSSALRASASACCPTPLRPISTSSASSTPLRRFSTSRRWPTMNSALHKIAQLSAISSTIRPAAVLWRRKVDRMGRISMG